MTEKQCEGPTKCGWVESERLLAKTFDAWRAEFREILEEHRKDIQSRLEKIERQIEQKSDKDYVALMISGVNSELETMTPRITLFFFMSSSVERTTESSMASVVL